MRTDDPIADFLAHDAEQQSKLDRLPKCDICGEPILDEYFYNIDGTLSNHIVIYDFIHPDIAFMPKHSFQNCSNNFIRYGTHCLSPSLNRP